MQSGFGDCWPFVDELPSIFHTAKFDFAVSRKCLKRKSTVLTSHQIEEKESFIM